MLIENRYYKNRSLDEVIKKILKKILESFPKLWSDYFTFIQDKHTFSLGLYLHGGDDHSSVHDELSQRCGALVAVPAVNHEQPTDVLKLSDGEVCSQRRLLPFLFTHKEIKENIKHIK